VSGKVDLSGKVLSQGELSKTLDFCANAFQPIRSDEDRAVALKTIEQNKDLALDGTEYKVDFSIEQINAVNHIRARKLMRTEDTLNNDSFQVDVIDGYAPNLVVGSLGLKSVALV